MTLHPLLILDFDGVIIDGLLEYWSSSRKAYFVILGRENNIDQSNSNIPNTFRTLRPWVKNGWEMVLIAAEIINRDSFLNRVGAKAFANEYEKNCSQCLKTRQWIPTDLQTALDNVRREAIQKNSTSWLKSHKAFPFVVKRLQQLEDEKIDFGVLTTKSAEFTETLLSHLNLYPKFIHGHESGSKPKLLSEISKECSIAGFIEDRRKTLETVIKTPGINSIPCYLAEWGYLKPLDSKNLPLGIHLLKTKKLMSPLANWA